MPYPVLDPDKVALTILYLMNSDEDGSLGDTEGLSAALYGLASTTTIQTQLARLANLGLIVGSGPQTIAINNYSLPGREWWSIAHDGGDLVYSLRKQPRSFLRKLHEKGIAWLREPGAKKANLGINLTQIGVQEILKHQPRNWGKIGAIAALIAIPLAIIAIAVTIWVDQN